jgi:hypothetical protein
MLRRVLFACYTTVLPLPPWYRPWSDWIGLTDVTFTWFTRHCACVCGFMPSKHKNIKKKKNKQETYHHFQVLKYTKREHPKFREVIDSLQISKIVDFRNLYLSIALQPFVGPWPLFQFLNLIYSRKDSLDGRSARRKVATYTQNNTNTE